MADEDIERQLRRIASLLESTQRAVLRNSADITQAFSNKQKYDAPHDYDTMSPFWRSLEKQIADSFKSVAKNVYSTNYKGHTAGDLKDSVNNKITHELNRNSEALLEIQRKLDATGSSLGIFDTKEGLEILHRIVEKLEKNSDNANTIYDQFGSSARDINSAIIDLSKTIETWHEEGKEYFVRVDSVFSQAAEDVRRLHRAVDNITDTASKFQTDVSDEVNKLSQTISNLANQSSTVNAMMTNMSQNMADTSLRLQLFSQMTSNATSASLATVNQINNLNTALGHFRNSVRSLTNANAKALQRLQNASNRASSGSNSFRQQATRNSDRAKQAGFIALLIPALAKLLKKTPVTDYFKLLALRFGAGSSGTGEHPVLGAIGLAAAPILSGALLSSVFRRQIMSIGGKLLGVPAASSLRGISQYGMPPVNPFWIPKNMNGAKTLSWLHPLRSLQNLKHLVADRTVAFQRGWNAPNDIWRRSWNKANYNYHSLVRDANGNIMRWQNPLTGRNVPVTQVRTGQIMNAKMYDWGAHMARVFKPISALGKSPFVAGLLKLGGGVLKKLPLIGAAFDVGSDIYQGKHAGKSLLSAGAATGIGLATGGWGFL